MRGLRHRQDRHGQAARPDRAHRLPGARRRLADQCAVPRQAGRILPLGRNDAGHHRHRDGDADPRGAGPRGCRPRPPSPPRWRSSPRRYRDTPMVGRSNLQQAVPVTFGYKMAGAAFRHRAPSRAPRAASPARADGRVRRRGRHARVHRRRRHGDAGRTDAGTRPRPAGDRLAHDPRHDRRGWLPSSVSSAGRLARCRWT